MPDLDFIFNNVTFSTALKFEMETPTLFKTVIPVVCMKR